MRLEFSKVRPSALAVRLLCVLVFACLAGCSQDLGEECQVADDCSGNLVCNRSKGSERGVCQDPRKLTPVAQPDSGAGHAPSLDEDAGSPPAVQEDASLGGGDAG